MNLLFSIYAAAGALFAGYALGTVDKEPIGALELVAMGCLFAFLWPYWIGRAMVKGYRQARARGGK